MPFLSMRIDVVKIARVYQNSTETLIGEGE